jgi:hypothetical protein
MKEFKLGSESSQELKTNIFNAISIYFDRRRIDGINDPKVFHAEAIFVLSAVLFTGIEKHMILCGNATKSCKTDGIDEFLKSVVYTAAYLLTPDDSMPPMEA